MRNALLSVAAMALAGAAQAQTLTKLVPGSAFHGVHGIRFAPDGELYAGSVIGQSLYSVNVETGAWRVVEPPPKGMADDIAFGPNGQVVWTAISVGTVYTKRGKGPVEVLAKDLPGANSVVFTKDGKHLYLGQVFAGDAVWELDPAGVKPPRQIVADVGGFNSFDVGPDGALYGPQWFKGQIGRIDPNTGAVTKVADGFQTPAAAKFGPDGYLYALDTKIGVVYRVDVKTGTKSKVAQLTPSLDNMAFDAKGRLFVSNMSDNGIQQVNITGKTRQVIKGALANPYDIAVSTADGKDTLYVADGFAYRSVDGQTGKVTTIARAYSDDITSPNAVAVAGDKVLLVGGGRVDVRDRLSGKRITQSEPFRGATDVVGLPNGDWIVSLAGGDIVRVSGAERQVIASGLKMPVSLALGPGDSVYVAERDAGKITRVDLKTGDVTMSADGFQKPRAIAFTPTGELVILDVGAKQVVEFDRAAQTRKVLAKDLPVGYLPNAPSGGIAVGAKGDVYISSDVENAIYKISR